MVHKAKVNTKPLVNLVVLGMSKISKKVNAGTTIGEPSGGHDEFWRISFAFKSRPQKPKKNVMKKTMAAPTRKPLLTSFSSLAAYTRCQNAKLKTSAPKTEKHNA